MPETFTNQALSVENTRHITNRLRTLDLPEDRRFMYRRASCRASTHPEFTVPEIPKEDLLILQKLYHKLYPDCGRKRGALLRYIQHFRKEHEPKPIKAKFFKFLTKKSNQF